MAIIVDGLIILLLAGSIGYGYMVSRRVKQLMGTLEELEPMVEQFSTAVTRSQDSVTQLKDNLETAERVQEAATRTPEPGPAPPQRERFASRRSTAAAPQRTIGVHAVRDKKELVRAFFEKTEAAGV